MERYPCSPSPLVALLVAVALLVGGAGVIGVGVAGVAVASLTTCCIL